MIVLVLILLAIIYFLLKSKSNKVESFQKSQSSGTSDTSYRNSSKLPDGTVGIFYAPWCGHCKASMDEFEKARDSSNGKVLLIDSEEPVNEKLLGNYDIEGFPTIIRASDNKVYSGPRTAENIINFANK
jgi:thiol-disulfide isomerase/thioredoxin